MGEGESQARGGRREKLGGGGVTPAQKLQQVPERQARGSPGTSALGGPWAPAQTQDRKGRERNKQTGGRARYPEGGCLLLAAPRSRRGEGGTGTGSVASAVAPEPAPAEQPERPRLHARAQAPGATRPKAFLSLPRLLPSPPGFGGREQHGGGCVPADGRRSPSSHALYLQVRLAANCGASPCFWGGKTLKALAHVLSGFISICQKKSPGVLLHTGHGHTNWGDLHVQN